MKRFLRRRYWQNIRISFILIYIMVFLCSGVSVTLASDKIAVESTSLLEQSAMGDINDDSSISITDYTLVRLHILELKSLQEEAMQCADINCDGQITITDYTLVRLHILGLKPIGSDIAELPLLGFIIGLDPGHQRESDTSLELISPNGTEMKKKVSSGTQGRFTRVPEYVVNLQAGLKLRTALEALGATVIITRDTHDINISNAQRAVMMNEAHVDCWLRIHADGNDDTEKEGISILVPTPGCMDTSDASVAEKSALLANDLLSNTANQTGAINLGIKQRSDQTGFCWSKVPVCNIEMGYMTNEKEDNLLVTSIYQDKIVKGLADGFIDFFLK